MDDAFTPSHFRIHPRPKLQCCAARTGSPLVPLGNGKCPVCETATPRKATEVDAATMADENVFGTSFCKMRRLWHIYDTNRQLPP
ncbi:hypothetical protein E2P81_ATG01829 [Venturia nashicola]|uniref:Uncharacterized protein n=1 Tax=Venturia nashicola TaxID=86259 RepID=A0A4Z1PHN2_9PEZI|nr:hypothetical protein E6O75_ATG01874 [Venturia nashicola]TLD35526.1 hypothetical protein E2P81_ATG01829 [Venturia nashicola]